MARVMVVADDSPTDRQFLRQALVRAGYDVLEAASGQDAIQIVRQHHPDCVIMDIVMPGMNGFHATRTLAKDPNTSSVPVIVVSSKDQPTDRLWALRQGAREYMVKPVREEELIEKIKSLVGG